MVHRNRRVAGRAAVFPVSGGMVNVVPAPGLPTYAGSTAKGSASSNDDPWSASFTFRR